MEDNNEDRYADNENNTPYNNMGLGNPIGMEEGGIAFHSNDKNESISPDDTGNNTEHAIYRGGYSTSLSHLFHSRDDADLDCCSLVCCGVLQHDYDRYVVLGIRPPSFTQRAFQHIVMPFFVFVLAGYFAVKIPYRLTPVSQVICTLMVLFIILWVIRSCLRGRVKRKEVRVELSDLLYKKRVNDVNIALSPEEMESLKEEGCDRSCMHRICGCVSIDHIPKSSYYDTDSDQKNTPYKYQNEMNFLGKISHISSRIFCGNLLGCWWQVFGVCALAQEAREIRKMVPAKQRRMDYVTFEPFLNYINSIRKLREEKNGNLIRHYGAISKLSRMLLKLLALVTIILFIFSLFGLPSFKISNMIVFIATLFQAFIIVYLVHWQWNRFDISLDAVIKYFASGFLLSTSTALFFECVEVLFLRLTLEFIMLFTDIDVAEPNEYKLSNENPVNQNLNLLLPLLFDDRQQGNSSSFFDITSIPSFWASQNYKRAFNEQYPLIAIIYLFISAFIVAALVEELCKYFGYKMIEHPDLLPETALNEAASIGIGGDDGLFGGSNAIGHDGRDDYYYGEDSDSDESDAEKVTSSFKTDEKGTNEQSNQHLKDKNNPIILYPANPRSLNTIRVAITVAMVTAALGFACCENLIYVFIYNGSSLNMEIGVLLARSLFPVHPLCAAIQSLGVCKRELENDRSLELGSIILPAILLHGSYDFTIMLLNFLSELSDGNDENNDDISGESLPSLILSILSLCFSVLYVVTGCAYYYRMSRNQKRRIEQIEAARNFVGIRA